MERIFMVFHRGQSLVRLFPTTFCVFNFLEGVAVASYADDTTPYNASETNDLVVKEIRHFSKVLFQWFGSV